jgi:hypothetical protein
MIDGLYYKGQFSLVEELSEKLNQRDFYKTELDLVYSDIVNWERHGLLEIGGDNPKGNWKKINYIEYVWITIIKELRDFGFSYSDIKQVKAEMFKNIKVGQLIDAISQVDEEKLEIINTLDKNKILNEKGAIDRNLEIMTLLELLIHGNIINADPTIFFVSKSNPNNVIPMSKEVIEGYIQIGNYDDIITMLFQDNFCSISLNKIINKFCVNTDHNTVSFSTILNENEKKLLKVIRKNTQSLKYINVIFKDGDMDRIEVATIKKTHLESRLIDHIKKGDYKKITIDTVDGNIVNFENIEKIKL